MSRDGRYALVRSSLAPLRGRQFRYQFGAQATAVVGNALSPVALSLGILSSGLSTVDLGLVLTAYTVPLVLFVLVGGVIGDRLPRHRVMVLTNLVCAVTQCTVGVLLFTEHPPLWALVALQIVMGTATAFYAPASTGLTANTVDRDQLQHANALLSLTKSIGGSLGPLGAGILVITLGAGWALVIDGVTFAVGAVLLGQVRVPPRAGSHPPPAFRTAILDGFREVRRRTWVWSSIGAFAASNLAVAALFVLGPALLLMKPAGEISWGAVVAAISIGHLLGNLLSLWLRPERPILAARLAELAQVPLLVAVALHAGLPVLIVTAVACGVGMAFPDNLWRTTLQRHLPEDSISRISSYDWMGSLALRPIGYAGAAAVAAKVGLAETLLTTAVLVLVTKVATAALPGVWALRDTSANVPQGPPETGTVAVSGTNAGAAPTDTDTRVRR